MEHTSRAYYPSLDGLRFVAFLLVFIHNAPYDQANRVWEFIRSHAAGVGVDFFFCLSGYLVTAFLSEEYKTHRRIDLWAFYRRRALRILPIYLLMVALSVGYTAYQRGWIVPVPLRAAGLLTFTDNIVTAFDEFTLLSFAFHLWTVSYDVQFYLLVPFIIPLLVRTSSEKQIAWLGGLFGVGILVKWLFIYTGVSATAIYVLSFTHVESLLGGVVLGLWGTRLAIKQPMALGLVLLGVSVLLPDKYMFGWHLLAWYPLVGVGVTLIVFALLRSSSVLAGRWLTGLGKISYGLYIYHIMCIYLALGIFLHLGWEVATGGSIFLLDVLSLGLTLVFAAVSYRVVEVPFLRRK